MHPLRVRLLPTEGRLEFDGVSDSIALPGECSCVGWHVRARMVEGPALAFHRLPSIAAMVKSCQYKQGKAQFVWVSTIRDLAGTSCCLEKGCIPVTR